MENKKPYLMQSATRFVSMSSQKSALHLITKRQAFYKNEAGSQSEHN